MVITLWTVLSILTEILQSHLGLLKLNKKKNLCEVSLVKQNKWNQQMDGMAENLRVAESSFA